MRGSAAANGFAMIPTPNESLPLMRLRRIVTWSPPTLRMPVPVGIAAMSSGSVGSNGFVRLFLTIRFDSISTSSVAAVGSPGRITTITPDVFPVARFPRSVVSSEFSTSMPIGLPVTRLRSTDTRSSTPT